MHKSSLVVKLKGYTEHKGTYSYLVFRPQQGCTELFRARESYWMARSAILEYLAPDKENLNKAECISEFTFQALLP